MSGVPPQPGLPKYLKDLGGIVTFFIAVGAVLLAFGTSQGSTQATLDAHKARLDVQDKRLDGVEESLKAITDLKVALRENSVKTQALSDRLDRESRTR